MKSSFKKKREGHKSLQVFYRYLVLYGFGSTWYVTRNENTTASKIVLMDTIYI